MAVRNKGSLHTPPLLFTGAVSSRAESGKLLFLSKERGGKGKSAPPALHNQPPAERENNALVRAGQAGAAGPKRVSSPSGVPHLHCCRCRCPGVGRQEPEQEWRPGGLLWPQNWSTQACGRGGYTIPAYSSAARDLTYWSGKRVTQLKKKINTF